MPLCALNVPLQLDQGFFGSWPRRTESDEIFVSNFKSIQVHAFYRSHQGLGPFGENGIHGAWERSSGAWEISRKGM